MAVPSPSDPSIRDEKKALRDAMRKERRRYVAGLEPSMREALEEQVAEHLSSYIAAAKVIGAYCAFGCELSPEAALTRARRLGKTVAYPAFGEDEDIFRFRAGEPAMPGPHRIPQPAPDAEEVIPDLVLVPLVAVGHDGWRIGQGKGHFDRVLPGYENARIVGIGWSMQRLQREIPHDGHDVPLDMFVCPQQLETFER